MVGQCINGFGEPWLLTIQGHKDKPRLAVFRAAKRHWVSYTCNWGAVVVAAGNVKILVRLRVVASIHECMTNTQD